MTAHWKQASVKISSIKHSHIYTPKIISRNSTNAFSTVKSQFKAKKTSVMEYFFVTP